MVEHRCFGAANLACVGPSAGNKTPQEPIPDKKSNSSLRIKIQNPIAVVCFRVVTVPLY